MTWPVPVQLQAEQVQRGFVQPPSAVPTSRHDQLPATLPLATAPLPASSSGAGPHSSGSVGPETQPKDATSTSMVAGSTSGQSSTVFRSCLDTSMATSSTAGPGIGGGLLRSLQASINQLLPGPASAGSNTASQQHAVQQQERLSSSLQAPQAVQRSQSSPSGATQHAAQPTVPAAAASSPGRDAHALPGAMDRPAPASRHDVSANYGLGASDLAHSSHRPQLAPSDASPSGLRPPLPPHAASGLAKIQKHDVGGRAGGGGREHGDMPATSLGASAPSAASALARSPPPGRQIPGQEQSSDQVHDSTTAGSGASVGGHPPPPASQHVLTSPVMIPTAGGRGRARSLVDVTLWGSPQGESHAPRAQGEASR